MPPKPKVTREEIVQAAFELTRAEGPEAVTARRVGGLLGTTTSPVFTFFSGMEELKEEVFLKAKKECEEYLIECMEYRPAFKEFGIRITAYAQNEPQLYRLLFAGNRPEGSRHLGAVPGDVTETILNEIMGSFGLDRKDTESLYENMLMLSNGIAAYLHNGGEEIPMDQMGKMLSESCLGLVMLYKTRAGTLTPEVAHMMATMTHQMPVRIER